MTKFDIPEDKPKKQKFELPPDFPTRFDNSTLSDEEKLRIIAKARESVEEEKKRQDEEDFLDAAIRVERRRHRPHEQLVDVLVDLPGHALRLLIDGVEYNHGFTYRVPVSQARSMWEQMQLCWSHEHEIGGANRNFYRSPRNLSIGPQHINMPANRLLGI